jgi:hypothetical protein
VQAERRARAWAQAARIGLVVVEVVLFAVSLVIAVRLGSGAPAASNDDPSKAASLRIEDVRMSRRTTQGGFDVLVIAGVVHNAGDVPRDAVRVVATVGDQRVEGFAGGTVDAFTVSRLAVPADVDALQGRRPAESRVAAGDRASFVLVSRAPPDGTAVQVLADDGAASP